ncbi:MAG: glycosyltransferase [Chloroflexi bacterium]|nr:glycosyltransferase [Chloroflexota bacterium]
MKISLITPVFNDCRVVRAIQSILRQAAPGGIELIVVDGGSTDGTLQAIEPYAKHISRLISERDRGTYDAMNKGIAAATGDIVGILNSDDRYQDEHVFEAVAEAFDAPSIEACFGDLVYVNGEDRVVRYWRSGAQRRYQWHLGWMPPHPTFFVRRSVYERFGKFDLSFPIAADYELMLRLLYKHRLSTAYIPRVLVRMELGGKSNRSVRNVVRANLEVLRAWHRNGLRFGYFAPLSKPARKLTQFRRGREYAFAQPHP